MKETIAYLKSLLKEKESLELAEPVKKGRGRPRKNPISTEPKPKGKRGRPRKDTIWQNKPHVV